MNRTPHRNHERAERRISAATSLLMCALTVLAQIAVTLLLAHFLKEKASFVYAVLQIIGVVVAVRVYLRTGSPSYKLSWMCLLLILPVSGMILFCLWGGTHQAKQLSLRPVPPIPQRESAKMLSDMNQAVLTRRSPGWGRLSAYLQKRQFWLYRNTSAAYFGDGEAFFRDLSPASAAGGNLYFHGILHSGGGNRLGRDFRRSAGAGGGRGGNPSHHRRFRHPDPAVG